MEWPIWLLFSLLTVHSRPGNGFIFKMREGKQKSRNAPLLGVGINATTKYRLIKEYKSWDDARAYCQAGDGKSRGDLAIFKKYEDWYPLADELYALRKKAGVWERSWDIKCPDFPWNDDPFTKYFWENIHRLRDRPMTQAWSNTDEPDESIHRIYNISYKDLGEQTIGYRNFMDNPHRPYGKRGTRARKKDPCRLPYDQRPKIKTRGEFIWLGGRGNDPNINFSRSSCFCQDGQVCEEGWKDPKNDGRAKDYTNAAGESAQGDTIHNEVWAADPYIDEYLKQEPPRKWENDQGCWKTMKWVDGGDAPGHWMGGRSGTEVLGCRHNMTKARDGKTINQKDGEITDDYGNSLGFLFPESDDDASWVGHYRSGYDKEAMNGSHHRYWGKPQSVFWRGEGPWGKDHSLRNFLNWDMDGEYNDHKKAPDEDSAYPSEKYRQHNWTSDNMLTLRHMDPKQKLYMIDDEAEKSKNISTHVIDLGNLHLPQNRFRMGYEVSATHENEHPGWMRRDGYRKIPRALTVQPSPPHDRPPRAHVRPQPEVGTSSRPPIDRFYCERNDWRYPSGDYKKVLDEDSMLNYPFNVCGNFMYGTKDYWKCWWPLYHCNRWLYYGAFSIDNCIVAATWPHNSKYNSWRVTDCSKEGARTRKYWFLCEFPNAAGK